MRDGALSPGATAVTVRCHLGSHLREGRRRPLRPLSPAKTIWKHVADRRSRARISMRTKGARITAMAPTITSVLAPYAQPHAPPYTQGYETLRCPGSPDSPGRVCGRDDLLALVRTQLRGAAGRDWMGSAPRRVGGAHGARSGRRPVLGQLRRGRDGRTERPPADSEAAEDGHLRAGVAGQSMVAYLAWAPVVTRYVSIGPYRGREGVYRERLGLR